MDEQLITRVATYLRDRELVVGKIIEGMDEAFFGNRRAREDAMQTVADLMEEGQVIATESGAIQCVPEGRVQWKPAKEHRRVKRIKYLKNYGGANDNPR